MVREEVENKSILFVNHVFLIHCLNCNLNFKSFGNILATFYSLFFDGLLVYSAVNNWINIPSFHEIPWKMVGTKTCVTLCALCTRIWFHLRGRTLISIIRMLQKINGGVMKNICKDARRKTTAVFALHTAYFSITFAAFAWNASYIDKVSYALAFGIRTDNIFLLNFMSILTRINLIWFIIAPFSAIIIYYYFVCYLIENALTDFTSRLERERDGSRVLSTYSKMTEAVFAVIDAVQTPLLLASLTALCHSFFNIYLTLLLPNRDRAKTLQAILILGASLSMLCLMCVCASRITESYDTMRNALHKLLMKDKKLKKLSLTLRVFEEESLNFTLLGSIFVNRCLVVNAFGSMVTYGIMVTNLGKSNTPALTLTADGSVLDNSSVTAA